MQREPFKQRKPLTDFLYEVRDDLIARAYRGAVYGTKTALLARELKNTALRYVASSIYDRFITGDDEYEMAVSEVTDDNVLGLILPLYLISSKIMRAMCYKARGATDRGEKARIAQEFLKQANTDKRTARAISREINELDMTIRRNYVKKGLKKDVFFLVSKHEDSAEDHKDYQGRVYVNRNWKDMVSDRETRKLINVYISKNRILEFQWIVDKPVYMITRPNCRHYFMSLPTNEVLNNTADVLLEKYDMVEKVGERGGLQTLQRLRNINSTIDTYSRRLAYYDALYKAYPTQELEKAITKNRFLLRRWRKRLKQM